VQAAEILMDRVRTGESAERRHIVLSTTLVVRESSRRMH
jgi:DNA-binding LacI/PurR family transcriptional regulator